MDKTIGKGKDFETVEEWWEWIQAGSPTFWKCIAVQTSQSYAASFKVEDKDE